MLPAWELRSMSLYIWVFSKCSHQTVLCQLTQVFLRNSGEKEDEYTIWWNSRMSQSLSWLSFSRCWTCTGLGPTPFLAFSLAPTLKNGGTPSRTKYMRSLWRRYSIDSTQYHHVVTQPVLATHQSTTSSVLFIFLGFINSANQFQNHLHNTF